MARIAESQDVIRLRTFAAGSFLAVTDAAFIVEMGDRQADARTSMRESLILDTAFLAFSFSPLESDPRRELLPVRRIEFVVNWHRLTSTTALLGLLHRQLPFFQQCVTLRDRTVSFQNTHPLAPA